jgi:hypothetical protein
MTNAHRMCDHASLDVEDVFAYQYLVAPGRAALDGFDALPFGKFSVYSGRKLHKARVFDAKQRFFGYVLGIAVDREGLITGDRQLNDIDLDDPQVFSRFAEYLDDVAGRYVFICAAGIEQRIYTDPVAMIGCVYDPKSRRAGSSLNLVLDRELVLNPKYEHEVNETRGGKYTLFHTRDAEAVRLNGSFYLDLYNMVETRFWPRTTQFEVPRSEYGAVYDEIIETARRSIGAVTSAFKTSLPLSAGRDSRLIAGFAGDHIKDVTQVYTHITNYATRYDAAIAGLMAKHLDVEHEVHSWRKPKPPPRTKFEYRKQARQFQAAVGARVPVPDEIERNVHQLVGDDHVVIRGHLTDLLRAVYVFTGKRKRWKDLDWQMQRLFPVPVNEFNAEVYERFLPDFVAWRRTLPPAAMDLPLDFMFIEVYYNSTVGFTFNGLHKQFYMSPFNSRRLIELSLSISVDYRRTHKPVDDILYRIDPELCALPYYKEGGADLSLFADESDWKEFTELRMEDVKARFDAGYAQADKIIQDAQPHLKVVNG